MPGTLPKGIYQRADGRYEAKLSTGRDPLTGKRTRVSVYGETVAEVDVKLTELKHQRNRGLPVTTGRLTVA